jgi:hypothetical protein
LRRLGLPAERNQLRPRGVKFMLGAFRAVAQLDA